MINNLNRIRTRLSSGFVLEVTPNSSGQHRLVAASPVDQNLYQYFVFTEVLGGQNSYTIENTAATGAYSVFLELARSFKSTPSTVIASPRRFDDKSQEWMVTKFAESDYYVIQSVQYPGIFLDLDEMAVNASSQVPQGAFNQQWALIPADGPPDSTDLPNLEDQVAALNEEIADLKEEIEEKESDIKDRDEEIKKLKEGVVVDGYDAAGWKDKYLSSESTRAMLAEQVKGLGTPTGDASNNITATLDPVRGTGLAPDLDSFISTMSKLTRQR